MHILLLFINFTQFLGAFYIRAPFDLVIDIQSSGTHVTSWSHWAANVKRRMSTSTQLMCVFFCFEAACTLHVFKINSI